MSQDAWTSMLLLGTARASSDPPAPHPALAAAWQRLPWPQREIAVLHGTALVAAARLAGALPREDAALPSPCPPDPTPVCAPVAADLLRRLLGGEQAACLREWLELASARGCRAAHRDLPALLAAGTQRPDLRVAIGRVLGERGRWLARRHEAHSWALGAGPDLPDEVWQTGTAPERAAWLRRCHDRDPAAAVAALSATWGDETGDQREVLLAAITATPHLAAAQWLERIALRDRRSAVRQRAQLALLRLPRSALAVRARERVRSLLRLEGLLQKRFVVTLPEAFDPAWQADGVDEKPPPGTGPRAHWARQLLGMVPLAHLLATFPGRPEQLFAWNRDDDSRDLLRLAFVDAARLDTEPAVAAAFAREQLLGDRWPLAAGPRSAWAREWLAQLPPAAARAAIDTIAEHLPGDELYAELLVHGPLPAVDPAAVAAGLLAVLQRGRVQRAEAAAMAAHAAAATVPLLQRQITALSPLPTSLEAFAQALDFRMALLQMFAVPASA